MFDIFHLHDDFLIINKHPGVAFHRQGDFPGLPNLVRERTGLPHLFPVHRLDTITSGLLVFGRSQRAARDLAQQFCNHQVKKFYLAISNRRPKKKQGLVKGDMVKGRRGAWKLLRSSDNPAISRFRSFSVGNGFRLYLVKPFTGKTHQIRVAMKSIGAPIHGDMLYSNQLGVVDSPDRGYLHAYGLEFQLSGEQHQFHCPPDKGSLFLKTEVQEVINNIKEPDTLFPLG